MSAPPPLTALRAFEAAGRHLSFRKAAGELHVTPAAISQQVRALEDHVGQPLFHRLTRALRLTEAGAAALPLLTEGFARIEEAVAAMRPQAGGGLLTVSAAPSFAARWLVPRLERFHERHPEVDIRLDASERLVDFRADGVDLALRYGRGVYPGLESVCLIETVAFPVCSPALLERGPSLARPEDLARHTLLHVHWKLEDDAAPNWRMWLRAAGVGGVDTSRGPRFSTDAMAIEAALAGQGVALAISQLVERDLADGRLVRPFPPSVQEATDFCYYLVYPPGKGRDARVRAFREWIVDEAGGG